MRASASSAHHGAPREPTRQMVEQAALWHAQRQSGEADGAALEAWRRADPAHETAWQRTAALWQRFDGLGAAPARAALEAAASRGTRNRGRAGRLAGGTAAALAIAWCGWQAAAMPDLLADRRSGLGETLHIALPDGSRLALDSLSAVDVRYGAHERRIVLRSGALLAEVAKDPGRPFVVETAQGTARALGTRFVVARRDGAQADAVVTVVESSVRACAAPGESAPACVDLAAGERVRLGAQGLAPVERIDADAAAARFEGQLVADNLPLAEVLAELGARRRGQLRFDAGDLAQVRVSGVLPLADTDRALEILAATLPIRVRRFTPWWVVVEPAVPAS
jgi:transmembrane sensor